VKDCDKVTKLGRTEGKVFSVKLKEGALEGVGWSKSEGGGAGVTERAREREISLFCRSPSDLRQYTKELLRSM
jgi:hypothetical protein